MRIGQIFYNIRRHISWVCFKSRHLSDSLSSLKDIIAPNARELFNELHFDLKKPGRKSYFLAQFNTKI